MHFLRKPCAVAATTLALAALPGTASAHDGGHPFDNCKEAYAAGYANIKEGDEHYGSHLDRDGDGIGCDTPPAGFVAAKDEAADDRAGTGAGRDLAETGGSDSTPYLAAGSVAALLAGSGVVVLTRKRVTRQGE
ncbi:LAETG motif-containing sortase-dependent surface protein [Streptomyces sp. NPDC090106]|uniref:LAETG motif-containing sortase-dependent surface protein n=1 Tax=Streptomyces sp. NPDC090106 TaxID=3365946 RepID=UPI0037FD1E23